MHSLKDLALMVVAVVVASIGNAVVALAYDGGAVHNWCEQNVCVFVSQASLM